MTTIKTMRDYGEAVDAGEAIEILFTRDGVDTWEGIKYGCMAGALQELIAQGEVRIKPKPKTITLYEYKHGPSLSWCERADQYGDCAYTGRTIYDGVIS